MKLYDGRYEIFERLGEGGMSTVELALDHEQDRLVAVKRLLPHRLCDEFDLTTFRRESCVMRHLEGIRGVPRLLGTGEVDGCPYLVMEHVEGVGLGERVDSSQLDWVDSADLVARAALRVDAVHRAGYTHRDVKPANFLIDHAEEIWLIDFGIAERAHSEATAAESEFILGTPSFMAPERVDPSVCDRRDPRSDVYSLGVILYEFLAGRLPFEGGSETQILSRVDRIVPPPPHEVVPEIPLGISDVAVRAMAPLPLDRFPSARDLAAAIFQILIPVAAERYLLEARGSIAA